MYLEIKNSVESNIYIKSMYISLLGKLLSKLGQLSISHSNANLYERCAKVRYKSGNLGHIYPIGFVQFLYFDYLIEWFLFVVAVLVLIHCYYNH